MPTLVADSPRDQSEAESPLPRITDRRQDHGAREPTPSVTPKGYQNNTNDDETDNDTHNSTGPQPFTSSQQGEQQDTTEAEDEWLMACRCENGKTLVTLLSCLQHVAFNPSDYHNTSIISTGTSGTSTAFSKKKRKKIQPVVVFCTPSGFTFHVCGPAKQSEASIELQKNMFSQYQVHQQSPDQEDWQAGGEFCVNLTTFMDALQWLGPLDGRTSVGLSYNLHSEIFKVELLHDSGAGSSGTVLCTTAIPGLMTPEDDPDGNSLSNAFRAAPVAARMMVRSGILRELLPEWSSVVGASCAAIAVSAKRGLEIAVLGHFGEAWVQIPPRGDHMVSPIELADERGTVTRSYTMHSLVSSMKALDIATESVISINAQGIMAIQHKTVDPACEGCSNFVDFIMTCLEDVGDDEDKEGEDASSTRSPQTSMRSFQNGQADSQETATQTSSALATPRHAGRTKLTNDGGSQTTSTPNNLTGDDVEQGGCDTEAEDESPRERQKRQALQRRKQEADSDDDDDDDTNNDASLAGPLFGSVVRDSTATSSVSGTGSARIETPPRRSSQRRTTARSKRQATKRSKSRQASNNSDASKDMLASSSDDEENANGDNNGQSSDEDDRLNLEALARSPVREEPRGDDSSSDEVVYG
jgi:Repair protein Rad1/Rec1/Rad17